MSLCCNPQDQPASFTESQPSTTKHTRITPIEMFYSVSPLFPTYKKIRLWTFPSWWSQEEPSSFDADLLLLVYCCLKLYGSHEGIPSLAIYHPLIFFFIFIFWCLRSVKKFMRFLVHALHSSPLCWTHTSHNVLMSGYSAVNMAFGQAPGAIQFIKALEPRTECTFPPFRHSCSWVTGNKMKTTSKTLWFYRSRTMCWCCCVPVWLMRAIRNIDLAQLVAAHLVAPTSTPAVYMSQWVANGGERVWAFNGRCV